jgi:hypothetical protein
MPEQPNRAQSHGDTDHFAEMERIVTESIGSGRPVPRTSETVTGHRREAHDPRDYPRRDTSWRDPQVRTTVRAGLTPQPMPNQLADLEALLRMENPASRADATAPQYAGMTPQQASNIETGSQMSGQYRGNAVGNEHLPDDEVTLPMHAVLKNGQPRAAAMDDRAAAVDPRMAQYAQPSGQPDAFNAYGRDPYASHDPHAAHDPAGALNTTHYAEYAQAEAAYYEDEALGQAQSHAQNPAYYAPQYEDDEDDYYARQAVQPQRRSSRSPLLMGGAIAAAVLVLGGGGFFAWRSFSHAESTSSGIPLIRADGKPVKELVPATQPTQVASGPNLDVARDGQDKLVTQTEDPVDKIPVKPVRVVGTQTATLAPVQRVHSVIVRPDGTFVSPETTASATPAPQPAPASTPAPTPAPATAQVPDTLKPLPPLSAPTQIATAPVAAPSTKPAQPIAVTKPVPVAPVPAAPPVAQQRQVKPEPAAPLALAPTPGQQPPTVRVANAPQATAPAQRTATVEGASGEYMVQISSARSDAEARHALQAAVQKYAALGIHGGDVQPADLGARGMYYRARLNGGSREQAAQLCQQIKAQGGDCVVAKR